MLRIYRLFIEQEGTVLRAEFNIIWSCAALVYNMRGQQDITGSACLQSGVGGAALQVTAGNLQCTLR